MICIFIAKRDRKNGENRLQAHISTNFEYQPPYIDYKGLIRKINAKTCGDVRGACEDVRRRARRSKGAPENRVLEILEGWRMFFWIDLGQCECKSQDGIQNCCVEC